MRVPFDLPLPLAVLVAALTVAALVWMVWRALLTRSLRKRFQNAKRLEDPQFLEALGAQGDDRALQLVVRKAMANLCDLPPERIHPQNSMRDLCRLIKGWDGWDDTSYLEALEQELGLELNPAIELPPPKRGQPFGEWATETAATLRLLVAPARPTSAEGMATDANG
jgi:hypothetical protein